MCHGGVWGNVHRRRPHGKSFRPTTAPSAKRPSHLSPHAVFKNTRCVQTSGEKPPCWPKRPRDQTHANLGWHINEELTQCLWSILPKKRKTSPKRTLNILEKSDFQGSGDWIVLTASSRWQCGCKNSLAERRSVAFLYSNLNAPRATQAGSMSRKREQKVK